MIVNQPIRTTCAYCGVGCGIRATVTGGRSVTIKGDAAHPAQCLVSLDACGTPLLARITRLSRDQLGLREGMSVVAQIKSVALLA